MKPDERENYRYSMDSDNPIDLEERVMFSLLSSSKKGRLLDIGCGVGTVSLELKKFGFDVHGIDFSSVGIAKAREKGIQATLCDVDKEGIPFEDNYFNNIYAGDVLEHVFDPIFLLEEIARVIRPNGKILISTPNDMNIHRRVSIFVTGKSPQSGIYRNFRQCKHHTIMSLELLEYMLNKAGFNRYSLGAIIRVPKIDKEYRYSQNKRLAMLFGRTLIVEAYG